MGNLLTECRRCQICDAAARLGIDQCELRPDPSPGPGGQRQGGAARPAGAAADAGRAARQRNQYQPADASEAELLQQALRLSRLEAERSRRGSGAQGSGANGDEDPGGARAGQEAEDELLAAAVRKAELEEESRERARLREEQNAEYEESLRIDREREAEKALKLKEEEERKQREAAEAEAKKREAERLQAEAEEAQRVKQAKVDAAMEEARKHLTPEPEAGEPNRVQVLIRTPHGARLKRAFRASDPVGQLYHYVNAEGGEDLAGSEYRLVSSMPRAIYEDREATLEAVGLQGQCAILVESMED